MGSSSWGCKEVDKAELLIRPQPFYHNRVVMWTCGHKVATHEVRPYWMSSARWELTAPLSQAGAASRGQNQPGSSIGVPEDAKAFLWDPSGTRWVQAKASLLCTTDPSQTLVPQDLAVGPLTKYTQQHPPGYSKHTLDCFTKG